VNEFDVALFCARLDEPDRSAKLAAMCPAHGLDARRVGEMVAYLLRENSTPPPAPTRPETPEVPGHAVVSELGRGGMGVVYHALDLKKNDLTQNRPVAVKVLRAGHHVSPQDHERLRREGERMAKVRHPNVVEVYEVGDTDSSPYICMQLCLGGPLSAVLADGTLIPEVAARVVEQVARGVAAIHARGIIHRDLKPANILFARPCEAGKTEQLPDCTPKVTDFGMARFRDVSNELTASGAWVGTPSYMAPEQADAQSVDERADVWAIGAILYECLTGRPPFKGSTHVETLAQARVADPPNPRLISQTPPALADICLKCLNKRPNARYRSAEDLADDLLRFLAHERPLARARTPIRWTKGVAKWLSDHWARVAWSAVVLLVVAALVYVWRMNQTGRIRDELQQRLTIAWATELTEEPAKDRVEADIGALERIDPQLAAAADDQYLSKLIERGPPRATDLDRIDRLIDRQAARGPAAVALVRTPIRRSQFQAWVAPEGFATKLDSLFRPQAVRIPVLEQAVHIGDRLDPDAADLGARPRLLRACLAAGDFERARSVAEELLGRPALLPPYQLLAVRDLVWIAASAPSQPAGRARTVADRWLDEPTFKATDGSYRPEYLELMVERARLDYHDGKYDAARRVLDDYLAAADRGALDLKRSRMTVNRRFPQGPMTLNVPAVFYLEAVILRGMLCKPAGSPVNADTGWLTEAEKIWKDGYERFGGSDPGWSYEGAVLASLAQVLSVDDARQMMTSTAENAESLSPVVDEMRNLTGDKEKSTAIADILKGAWRPGGLEFARQVASHQMPYGKYLTIQIRLWIHEGIRVLTRGRDGKFVVGEHEIFWRLTEDLVSLYSSGELKEEDVGKVLRFAREVGWQKPDLWPQYARDLPAQIRGPIAYAIGRAYRLQTSKPSFIPLPDVAPPYFQDARGAAVNCPFPEMMDRLAADELRAR
jgi:hypothetical protein